MNELERYMAERKARPESEKRAERERMLALVVAHRDHAGDGGQFERVLRAKVGAR